MAYHRSTAANTPDLILIVNRDDFSLAVFSTQRDQNVSGWSLCTTTGVTATGGFYDVVVSNDTMWFITQRNVAGGGNTFYLERFNDDLLVDMGVRDVAPGLTSATARGSMLNLSSIVNIFLPKPDGAFGSTDRLHLLNLYAGPFAILTPTVEGLTHLNAQVSKVIIDNSVQPDVTPAGGTAVLEKVAATSWQVGLGWPIVDGGSGIAWVKLLPLAVDLPEGGSDHKQRRIVEVILRLFETSELKVGDFPVPFKAFDNVLDDPVPKFTGLKAIGQEGWDQDGNVNIIQTEHLPMTILSVTRKVAI